MRVPLYKDHPRVCGEHLCCHAVLRLASGSSPRMRGAHDILEAAKPHAGIIPAYAGSTTLRQQRSRPPGDHPRVCGEHQARTIGHRISHGSSPRMRGALRRPADSAWQSRIIPAYAGSTSWMEASNNEEEDHPRVCGEHGWCFPQAHRLVGSSPRMRGAPTVSGAQHHVRGIIPAYAGSTWFLLWHARCCEDHPRVCGEHRGRASSCGGAGGSSPRMRGAPAAIEADHY